MMRSTLEITPDTMAAAAQRRIRVVTSLDGIISQAKMAKKNVGTCGGNRQIRDHLAAIQRQLDLLAAELNPVTFSQTLGGY